MSRQTATQRDAPSLSTNPQITRSPINPATVISQLPDSLTVLRSLTMFFYGPYVSYF